MKKKKIQYRKINFIASENRLMKNFWVHPYLMNGLEKIAKEEHKSISWLIETALSDYFGVEVMLRKLKGQPRPAKNMRDNLRVITPNKKRA